MWTVSIIITTFVTIHLLGQCHSMMINLVMKQLTHELHAKCSIAVYENGAEAGLPQYATIGINLETWENIGGDERYQLTRQCPILILYLRSNSTVIPNLSIPTKRYVHYIVLQYQVGQCNKPLTPMIGKTSLSQVLNLASITPCRDKFQIWRKQICPDLDSSFVEWKLGQNIFERRQKMSCKLFRITTFNIPPMITATVYNNGGVVTNGGYEALMIDSVMKYLGITNVTKNRPTDNKAWGQEISPGVMTGLYGDLQNDRTDLAHANIWILPRLRRFADFTNPYAYSTICFLVIFFYKPSIEGLN